MWKAGFKYSWRKMDADKRELNEDDWSVDYAPLGTTEHNSIQILGESKKNIFKNLFYV